MIEARTVTAPRPFAVLLLLTLTLGACTQTGGGRPELLEPGVFTPTRDGPEGAPPGTCWGRTVTPAVIETVSTQVQVKPAKVNSDGSIAKLPEFRTEERQRIVKQRVDSWFETPCAEVQTEEFLASLQRALQARGYYAGLVNGRLDPVTRAAVQRFQVDNGGPDSSLLALATARMLGLIVTKSGTSDA
ncbi:MAG: peptidoglycan-binding protein [Sulfitobacter sp.]|nr:peptidoglycan-binding protein [Sulfitobacter sp.]